MARHVDAIRERLYEAAADPQADVAHAALWIAAEEYPGLDPDPYLDYLARLAERVTARDARGASGASRRRAMASEIFDRERFAGNADDYYDPRNSYLNDVIDRRLGIPITLAVIYLGVARRSDRSPVGLNTPGHFLILDEGVVIDPFHGACEVAREVLLAQIEKAGAPRPSERLDWICRHPADVSSILVRMLVNLRGNHLRRNDLHRALAAVDRLVHLDSENPIWLRDRGALYQRLDCPRAAAADLVAYLEHVPEDPEADGIRQMITRLSRDLPPLQ